MPEIAVIAALAEKNRVIGKDMHLPWHLPEDLKRFKRLTLGNALLMGRKTFDSLVMDFGGPLPNRRNVVLSSRGSMPGYEEVEIYASLDDALKALADEKIVWIGGGADIYRQFLGIADRLELTLVEGDYDGDTFFPEYEHLVGTVYQLASEELHPGFRFLTYLRKA